MLTLIGTVHLDPSGGPLLRSLLKRLQPGLITLEVSAYAVRLRETEGAGLLARLDPWRSPDGALPPGLQPVAAQLGLPFEYSVTEGYRQASGCELQLLGDDALSQRLLARLEHELLAPANLERLALEETVPLAERVEGAWTRARRELWVAPIEAGQRAELDGLDRALAERLGPLLASARSVVHVGGWEHLRGLSALLAQHQPEPLLLRT